jgi:hypothetical protein
VDRIEFNRPPRILPGEAGIARICCGSHNLGQCDHMNPSSNQWYVQTDFGALLGPMPVDALCEMARTGALLRRDQVRDGADGTWRLASDWPNLFDQPAPTPATTTPWQEPASPRDSHKIASNARLLDELLSPEVESPAPSPPASASVTLAEELEFEIDAPSVAPATAPTASPAVTAMSVAAQPTRTAKPPVTVPRPDTNTPSAVGEPTPLAEAPRPSDRDTTWQPPAGSLVRGFPTARASLPRPSRGRRWWPAAVTAAVLGLLAAVWWVWPRQRPDIYKQYVAIYDELQQRQGTAQDQDGWSQFAARAMAQLDQSIPWLEDQAVPGDREKSLLLYAGRDLQELIEHPQEPQPAQQKRLQVFFEQLADLYGTSQ